jgi:cation:H+ antiporter
MSLVSFEPNSLWVNSVVFVAAGAVVWLSGARLSRYADAIAGRKRLGHAFVGALFLGGITSLPELVTTVTASIGGNAPLAVNNILGGVAMQVAILAVADAVERRQPLSTAVTGSVVLLQGSLLISVLVLVAAGIAVGSMVLLGVDVWTLAIFAVAGLGLYSIKRYEADPKWQPDERGGTDQPAKETLPDSMQRRRNLVAEVSTDRLGIYTTMAGLLVVVGGYVLAKTGDAIAVQTGLGAGFVGAIFLALATSLPEVSTTLEAVRLGRYRLAFSNIFGTNLFDVALLFVADLFFTGSGVLEEVGAFSQFGALLGLGLTTIYLAGILRRGGRMVFRMGFDSMLVLVIYFIGVGVLYTLR